MNPHAVAAPDHIQLPNLAVLEPAARRRHVLSVLDLSPDEVLCAQEGLGRLEMHRSWEFSPPVAPQPEDAP
jgi:hypothetical protein